MPVSIRIAGNTTLPTLLAIQAKGYKLNSFYTKTGKKLLGSKNIDKLQSTYEAEKDGCRFSANDPEELLGLIAMWEIRGDDWKYDPDLEDNIYSELIESALVYDFESNIVED